MKTIDKRCRHPPPPEVLFTIYLEHALKEARPTLPRPTTSFVEEIPNKVAYADDLDFVGHNYADIKKIHEFLKKF